LGGASGIRAFPASEGFGSNGYLINSELRMQWSPRFTVGLLRDLGAVWEADAAHARYQGYGIQWSWRFLSGPSLPNTQLRFTIARRDRANPLPNPLTGTDRDGSLERTRLWLSLNGALR
jgi:hemolysin activation/secretion protein